MLSDIQIHCNFNYHMSKKINSQFKQNLIVIVTRIRLNNPTQHFFCLKYSQYQGTNYETCGKYFFMTNSRLSRNGFILVYQDILKMLNVYPRKDINNDRINVFIEFKVYFKYLS